MVPAANIYTCLLSALTRRRISLPPLSLGRPTQGSPAINGPRNLIPAHVSLHLIVFPETSPVSLAGLSSYPDLCFFPTAIAHHLTQTLKSATKQKRREVSQRWDRSAGACSRLKDTLFTDRVERHHLLFPRLPWYFLAPRLGRPSSKSNRVPSNATTKTEGECNFIFLISNSSYSETTEMLLEFCFSNILEG